jgi:trans-aconitate methyltransferase
MVSHRGRFFQVKAFLDSIPSASILADVGCGNGKYFGVRPDVAILGSDRSPKLVETAARRYLVSPSLRQCKPEGLSDGFLRSLSA